MIGIRGIITYASIESGSLILSCSDIHDKFFSILNTLEAACMLHGYKVCIRSVFGWLISKILIQRSAKVLFLGWVTRLLCPEASHAT